MEAAKSVSEEMAEIYLERNMQLQIPGWDFQGACLGLDIRRVVETGITPLINTGIAHKEAGLARLAREPSVRRWPVSSRRWKRWRKAWA